MNTTLLRGIVGSTAYGLAGPDSDVDRMAIFAVPTVALHGLQRPEETRVSVKPDMVAHEAAKWCRLALSGNPSVVELAWLPDDRNLYEIRTPLGDELLAIRCSFLSARRVRDAYLGYATEQFYRLKRRGDGTFSADTAKRTAKHARHLMRLCEQGLHAYRTGEIRVEVADPQVLHDFGQRVAAGDVDHAETMLAYYREKFDSVTSPLPGRPDPAPAEAWLRRVRHRFYQPGDQV